MAEFSKRRRALLWWAVMLGVAGAIGVFLASTGLQPKPVVAVFMGVVLVFAVVVNLKIWRCPACNGHLGRLYIGIDQPKFCPNCGIKLVAD